MLDDDYITVAQAKGNAQTSRVLWGYAARNAVLPQIQSFALSIGFIVGGTIVMEMVFSYPGVGKLLLDATNAKDFALMQGCVPRDHSVGSPWPTSSRMSSTPTSTRARARLES